MSYVVLEYREGHAAHDIQAFCERFAKPLYKLVFVLESERVIVFERQTAADIA